MADTTTVRVVARMIAKPETIAELQSVLTGLVEPTRVEEGCVSYELLQNVADSTDFTFVEQWSTDAALDAHLASPHLQAALERLGDLLAGEPDIQRYRLVR